MKQDPFVERVYASIPSHGIAAKAVYGAVPNADRGEVDNALTALMRSGRVALVLGSYQRVRVEAKVERGDEPESRPATRVIGVIDRSMEGLREMLFEQLERLRDGKIEPKTATAFATLAGTILKSAELTLGYARLRAEGKANGVLEEIPLVRLPRGTA